MALFDLSSLPAVANGDGEFKIAARFWNADVELDVGDEAYLLRMRDGRIDKFEKADVAEAVVKISAPRSDWEELLKPTPKAFYQDLYAAMTRQSFKVEGDMVGFNPYYRAINRLFELMRGAR